MWLTPHQRDSQPKGEREREREREYIAHFPPCLLRSCWVDEVVTGVSNIHYAICQAMWQMM